MNLDKMITQFAKALSDRIITKVHSSENALVKYVCPVYCESPVPRLSHIGSALLLQVGPSMVLVTAAHVFDHRNEGTLSIPGDHVLIPINGVFRSTDVPEGGTRDDDMIDVGVCRLDDHTASAIVLYSCLPIADTIADDRPFFGRLYSFVGYPNTRNEVRYNVRPAPYSFLNTPLAVGLYGQYKLQTSVHIALTYDKKRTVTANRKPTTFPDPHGLSGGGLWAWEIHDTLKLGNPEVSPKLVGVTTGHTKDKKAWYATKIGIALECVRAAFPDLDEFIPRPVTLRVNVNIH